MFMVGDRVEICVDIDSDCKVCRGAKGTVVREDDGRVVGVRWDDPLPGMHDCDGDCEPGYGWFVCIDEVCCIPEDMKEVSTADLNAILMV